MWKLFSLLVVLSSVGLCKSSCPLTFPETTTSPAEFSRPYDYLIVGGGTAGLTIASRLTDNPNVVVGVIEAGIFHDNDPLIDTPAKAGLASGNPNYDWMFESTPQENAADRIYAISRGKMIGGSTGLNQLAWTRASKDEYDAWASLTGNDTWSWDGLLPYFLRSTSVLGAEGSAAPETSSTSYNPVFEGYDGPVSASFNEWYSDAFQPYQESLQRLGLPINASPDNGSNIGISNSRSDVNRSDGTRAYAAAAYYCRYANRPNFHVLTGAQVTKVDFAHSSSGLLVATGIQYISGNQTFTVNASREVIISAGAIQSPQILELSGIGNKTILDSLGIETLLDLPEVGENYQDHLLSPIQFSLESGVLTFDALRINSTYALEQESLYNTTGQGIYAATNSALTFLPLESFMSTDEVHELQQAFDAATAALSVTPTSQLRAEQYAIQRSWLTNSQVPQVEIIMWSQGLIDVATNASYITVLAGGLHLLARGSVHINTTDPLSPPVINPSFLNNDFDVDVIRSVVEFMQTVGEVSPLSTIVVNRTSPPPNSNDTSTSLADVLATYVRETANSAAHPMGTVAMAKRELGGVLDSSLTVYGTTNLRVCDASVFPLGVGTHLQSTVYAVAEKFAEILKSEHGGYDGMS